MTTLPLKENLPPGVFALYSEIEGNSNLESLPNLGIYATEEKSVVVQLLDIALNPEMHPMVDQKLFDATCAEAARLMRGWNGGETAREPDTRTSDIEY